MMGAHLLLPSVYVFLLLELVLRCRSVPWYADVLCCGTVLDIRLAVEAGQLWFKRDRAQWRLLESDHHGFNFLKCAHTPASHSHRKIFLTYPSMHVISSASIL